MSEPAPDPDHLLAIYLADHRAAATAGTRLAQRLARSNAGEPWGAELADIAAEVEADERTLDEVLAALDVRHHPVKQALAVVGERIGLLKLNGRLIRSSPLSRVLELEGLIAGVNAKRQLWVALQAAAVDRRLAHLSLDALERRAQLQARALRRIHAAAAPLALGAPAPT